VTVPVARGSARRTVRVAVALVAGQAALCAVIGYLTLGGPHQHSPAAPAAGDPLAAGPLVVPPVQIMPPSAGSAAPRPPSAPTTRTTATTSATRRPPAAGPDRQRAAAEPPPSPLADPATAPMPPAAPTRTIAPTGPQFLTPEPTDSGVQQNVKVGDVCSPIGADGLTTDDETVRCVRGSDGQLRWQLV
jgi:hypothetical protein